MKSPKVSVVMPIYNTPLAHLKESIQSILNQTFTDFEYLILNDSPDNLQLDKLIAEYDDPRIKYLKNDTNVGLEASTNRLIDEAEGKYIAVFDHDDISLPERLEKEAKYLDEHSKVGAVSAQFRLFGIQNFDTSNPLDSRSIRKTLLTASCVSHTSLMVRKSVLLKHNIRYEKEFFPAASYRIITRLALVTDIVNLPEVLLRYRMDGNNTSIKHAEQRVYARERIANEFGIGLVKRVLRENGRMFDSVELLGVSPHFNTSRYYRVVHNQETFFLKAESKDLSNEYRMAKRMFEKSKEYFIEPIAFFQDEYEYLIMQWCDGESLEQYLKDHNTLTKEQKNSFIKDLYKIFQYLRSAGIVHRDITPKNILVTSHCLRLIDFHFAVEYDNYQELDFIRNNIGKVDMMGEPFAAGILKWDDAFSLAKIAEYIAGDDKDEYSDIIKKISSKIDERVIIPDGSILREVILRQKEALREKDEALTRFNSIRGSLPYRVIRKVYRIVKNLRSK